MVFKEEIQVILKLIGDVKQPAKKIGKDFDRLEGRVQKLTKSMKDQAGRGYELQTGYRAVGKATKKVSDLTEQERKSLGALGKPMMDRVKNISEHGKTTFTATEKIGTFNRVSEEQYGLLKQVYGASAVSKKGFRELYSATVKTGNASKQYNDITKKQLMNLDSIHDMSNVVAQSHGRVGTAMVRMGRSTNTNTRAHERFRMELLSVMFFGMALSKMFRGWIDNVLKMTGVTDLLSAVMTMFLLPVIVPLIEHIVKIATALMDLPAPIRGAVGAFMIFITIIGTAIFLFGQFALGYIGMKAAFPALAVALGGGIGAFLTFLGVLGLIAGAIVGFLAFMYLLIFDAIPGFFRAWDVVREMIREDIPYLNMFVEAIECIYNAFMKLLSLDIGGFFDEMGKALGKGIGGTVELIGSAFPSFQHGGIVPGSGPVPIMAHGGETILPAGMSGINYSPTYNINANISGGMDVDSLLDEIHSRDIANLRRHLIR